MDSWYGCSFLLLLSWSSWFATSEATVHVLLFLFRWFQDLQGKEVSKGAWDVKEVDLTYLERAQQTLVYAHHGACIVEFAAVIWCAKERDQLPLGEELVTVFHDLMCATNKVHIVLLQEA